MGEVKKISKIAITTAERTLQLLPLVDKKLGRGDLSGAILTTMQIDAENQAWEPNSRPRGRPEVLELKAEELRLLILDKFSGRITRFTGDTHTFWNLMTAIMLCCPGCKAQLSIRQYQHMIDTLLDYSYQFGSVGISYPDSLNNIYGPLVGVCSESHSGAKCIDCEKVYLAGTEEYFSILQWGTCPREANNRLITTKAPKLSRLQLKEHSANKEKIFLDWDTHQIRRNQ
mgnify:CR=1 FL=1